MNILNKLLLTIGAMALSFATPAFSFDSMEGGSGSGVTVYGEYLYWQISQDQMQYALILDGGVQGLIDAIENNEEAVDVFARTALIDPSFDYHSGFRVGAGYEVPCSNWDFQLIYARFHNTSSSHVVNAQGGVVPLVTPASSLFGFIGRDPYAFAFGTEATSRWKFDFDTFDVEIGRTYSPTHCLVVRPFIGLKAASIKQKQRIHYFGFDLDEEVASIQNTKKNDFRGIGPLLGIKGAWEFYPSMKLTSAVSGAFLCGKFDTDEHPFVSLEDNVVQAVMKNDKKNRLRPMVDIKLGAEWNPSFLDGFDVAIGVAYEAQYWWNQWLLPSSVLGSVVAGGGLPQGDLMLQGLSVNFSLGF